MAQDIVPQSLASAPEETSRSSPPTGDSSALPPPTVSPGPPPSIPTSTADGSQASADPAEASKAAETSVKGSSAESDDEDYVEENGSRGRGKPSNFSGDRLRALQKGLQRYMALNSRKEKIKFWPTFMKEIMEEFPLSKYPIPASRLAAHETFVEKTDEEIQALTEAEKNTYFHSLKAAMVTDEELYLQVRRREDGGSLQGRTRKKKKQVRPQFHQWVMKHDRYKSNVVARSSETGRFDRLKSRATAVKDVLADLPEEDVEALKAEYGETLKALDGSSEDLGDSPDVAEQRRRRKNFGTLAQDVLNIWRKLTGLNFTLLAGECIDGDADYDSCVVFSKPDKCCDMDECEGIDFDRFSNTFLMWLKDIHGKSNPESAKAATAGSAGASVVSPSTTPSSAPSAQVPRDDQPSAANQGKGKGKNKGNRKRRTREDELSGEETPEPSDPSDMGSDSEEEVESGERRPAMVQTAIDTTGLWEPNEEGLPVLKVAMSKLTRDQQAAFRRECAEAIGLTKAVEDLEDDIRRSRKGKSNSRYRGSQPTRRSGRIRAGEENNSGLGCEETSVEPERMAVDEQTGEQEESNVGGDDEVEAPGTDPKVASGTMQRVITSVNSVEQLPAWAQEVVKGHAQLDTPHMEGWARFDVEGCSTPFLKSYADWLLGPKDKIQPDAWTALVYKWIEVEELWNKANVEIEGTRVKLLKSRRPQGFLQWFKYGRLRWEELVPPEVQCETLAQDWWIWWSKVVNPRWRPSTEGMVMPGGNGSWEVVRIPGKDGFVLVLVSLRWWCDLLDSPSSDPLWQSTIKSVYWTLEELLKDASQLVDGNDQGGDDEETDDAERTKGSEANKRKARGGGRERKQRRA
ncbi:SERTA domain-containing protein 3 [Paramarasmius palmivorus]|uniref:SERTA domain-containing protein 3 n=1 Tax=Paramarasmius palmivorus TaxID=297713 RepID=A0AAW0BH52_9AGAR